MTETRRASYRHCHIQHLDDYQHITIIIIITCRWLVLAGRYYFVACCVVGLLFCESICGSVHPTKWP